MQRQGRANIHAETERWCMMQHLAAQQDFLESLLVSQQMLVVSLQALSSFVVGQLTELQALLLHSIVVAIH